MKNNSEFKRKLLINQTQLYDERRKPEILKKSFKRLTPKSMQYKYETRLTNKSLKTSVTPPMMTTLSAASITSTTSESLFSSLTAAALTTSLKTQTTTAATNINLATRQTSEETNKLKEIQRDPLQQQYQQLQQTKLKKCHLQNNNDKIATAPTHTQVAVASVKSTISNGINTGNTLLSYAYNNSKTSNSNRNNKNNTDTNNNNNDDNDDYKENVTSLRVTSSAAETAASLSATKTSCSSNKHYNNDKDDIIITSTLSAASLSPPSLIHHQRQKFIAANSTTTNTTTTTFYKPSDLDDEMANNLSSFKYWKTSCSATRLAFCNTFFPRYSFSNSSHIFWLLALVSMFTLFGCGHAGFACLSNPCVFGVCIDGLNR